MTNYERFTDPNASLSTIFEIALEDFKFIMSQPGFVIDMTFWFVEANEEQERPCIVCMAGACMVKTFKINRQKGFDVVSGAHRRKFLAIDKLRQGKILYAFDLLNEGRPFEERMSWPKDCHERMWLPRFENGPDMFLRYCETLLATLKKFNL